MQIFSAYQNGELIAGQNGIWQYTICLSDLTLKCGDKLKIGYDCRCGIWYHQFPQPQCDYPSEESFFSVEYPNHLKLDSRCYVEQHYDQKDKESFVSETYAWRDYAKPLISLNLIIIELKIIEWQGDFGGKIVVTMGDKSKNSSGIKIPTQAMDQWKHWLFIQPKGSEKPQLAAVDYLVISPSKPSSVLTTIPSIVDTRDIREPKHTVFDEFGNPVGNVPVKNKIMSSIDQKQSKIIRLQSNLNNFDKQILSNPSIEDKNTDYKLFWGEIHGHTVFSDGSDRTPEFYYQWARDVMQLDFSAITDHDFGIALYDPQKNWLSNLETTRRFNKDRSFVTLPAWEISHAGLAKGKDLYGHKNIYFLDDYPPFYNSSPYGKERTKIDYCDVDELIELLENEGQKFLIIDHTSHGLTDWDKINTKYDRLVEVCSFFGTSEWTDVPFPVNSQRFCEEKTSRHGLNMGRKLGFTGGTDTHMACPAGLHELTFKPIDYNSYRSPGLTAVWAKELTREAIFDALWNRRTYAVRGSRILVKFETNGQIMGSEIKLKSPDQPRNISILVAGTDELEKFELIHNNEIIQTWNLTGQWDFQTQFEHDSPLKGLPLSPQTNYYYIRVTQSNGHMAWSSPIWVSFEN